MIRNDYIRANAEAFAQQLQTFKGGIGDYAATLHLTAADTDGQKDDADYFSYVVAGQIAIRNGSQQWTSWRDRVRYGGDGGSVGEALPPALPPHVKAVEPGIEERFRELVRRIKADPNYNPGIGEALGIEGPETDGPDMTTIQPDIGARVAGNEVQVRWGWGGHSEFLDMCELQVDRGDGNYVLLAFDTTPNYTDTHPFPATPTKWTYRAIYHAGDHRVGQWSKPVSVTVGG